MSGLVLPALLLAALGWLVPRGLARVFPEGMRPLLALALASTLLMIALATGLFTLLYAWQGVPLPVLLEAGAAGGVVHFGRLGLASALIWAPILVLSVAGLPSRWTEETW